LLTEINPPGRVEASYFRHDGVDAREVAPEREPRAIDVIPQLEDAIKAFSEARKRFMPGR
jgi:hypothetical protein